MDTTSGDDWEDRGEDEVWEDEKADGEWDDENEADVWRDETEERADETDGLANEDEEADDTAETTSGGD